MFGKKLDNQNIFIMNRNIKPFTDLIKQRTGLSIEKLCRETVSEKINDLMKLMHLDSNAEYLQLLTNDENEFFNFLNMLTINETYFFREDEYIKIFSNHLIPELLAQINNTRKIRILSAGCSTGEEPYSLALALMEKFGPAYYNFFSITGIDIDNNAINTAKKGCYREKAFRTTDLYFKQSYFEKTDNKEYKINDYIKKNVQFMTFNLLNDTYPDVLKNMDIIFYRNVSIYFEKDIQKKILIKLSDILNPNGYLIVSSTETLTHSFDNILSLIKINDFFLFYKDKKVPENQSLTDSALSLVKQSTATQEPVKIKPENTGDLFAEALLWAKKKEYNKALDIIKKIIINTPDCIQGYMLHAGILINLNKFENAKEICLNILQSDTLSMEPYLLLGIIAKLENDFEHALKRFREALYINSYTWVSYFYMAEIYQKQEKFDLALQKYNNVIKLLEQKHFDNHGLTFFPFSFSEENLMHMCQYNIKQLEQLL